MAAAARRNAAADGDSSGAPIVAAVFALLGLFLAFTFSNAYSRLGARRELIVQEANDIGTAWLRLDLVPEAARRPLQAEFRAYAESRVEFWDVLPDERAALAELARAGELQQRIWKLAVAAVDDADVNRLVLPAINAMIDIVTTRTATIRAHPPLALFVVLFVLAVVCAWLAGADLGSSRRPGLRRGVMFALLVALTTYLILDIEYPAVGFVRLDEAHEPLREVLALMRAG
jgi:hypothetical protein